MNRRDDALWLIVHPMSVYAIKVVDDVARVQIPYPSIADVFYLAFYPLMLVGVLLTPARGLSGVRSWHLTVNGLLLISVIATFAWYFTIGPTVYADSNSLLGTLISASYPLGDVLLVTAILFIWLEVAALDGTCGLSLLVVGLISIVVGDTVYTYQSLHNVFNRYVTRRHLAGWHHAARHGRVRPPGEAERADTAARRSRGSA